jgi:hypothetical protein
MKVSFAAPRRRRIFDVAAMPSDTEDETGPDEIAELAAFDAAKYERPSRRLQHL